MNIPEFEFDRPTSAAQAIERAASILRSVGVDPHQIGIWLLRQHGKFDATHFNVYEDACELVEWLTTQPKLQQTTNLPLATSTTTLTATQVGQMLAGGNAEFGQNSTLRIFDVRKGSMTHQRICQ